MGRSSGLYLDDELFEFAKKRADAAHDGKLNAYIVSLVEKDREGRLPDGSSPAVIVELARRYAPAFCAELELQMNHGAKGDSPFNQVRIVARFLDALLAALMRKKDFNPEIAFELFSSYEKFLESIQQQPGILNAIQASFAAAASMKDVNLNEPLPLPRPKKAARLPGPTRIVPSVRSDGATAASS